MFKSRTVFVVAAGASADLDLPIGETLKTQISGVLAVEPQYLPGFKDDAIRFAVSNFAQQHRMAQGVDYVQMMRSAAFNVAMNMPLAPSIDTFLDANQADQLVPLMGKLAIARCILNAERKSFLYSEQNGFFVLPVKNENFIKAWHIKLWHELVSGITVETVDSIFDNVAFVVFNYDRCLEHFFYIALQSYFRIRPEHAARLVDEARIIHAYGVVGRLPWQEGSDVKVKFGETEPNELLGIALGISTFTESAREGTTSAIKEMLSQAETLVLLGFGFLEQNMDLMSVQTNISRVFMTALEMSNTDMSAATEKVGKMIGRTPDRSHREDIEEGSFQPYLVDAKCPGLWSAHRLRLPDVAPRTR